MNFRPETPHLLETSYRQRSPENARRLHEAIDQLESGRGKKRKLPDLG